MDNLIILAADTTPGDIGTAITGAFAGFGPVLLTIAGAGLALAVVRWGLPFAVGFFKKTAK